jgi:molybdenum-dependent DNA-binding transcriptional regulator ModE
MLPEVASRQLFLKHRFSSIFEFAAKLAGMSRDAVHEVLRLAEKLSDKPCLYRKLERGDVGWSKLRVVAAIALTETDRFWAEQVDKLPKHALEQLVRDIGRENQASMNEASSKQKQACPVMAGPGPQQVLSDRADQGSVLADNAVQAPAVLDRVYRDPRAAEPANQERVLVEPFQGTLDTGRNVPSTRRSVNIAIDPLVERRLNDFREKLSREDGKRLSLSDAIERLLTGYRSEGENLPRYEEVITACPECGKKHMKTARGEVKIDDADFKRRERKGEPVDLAVAKREATEKHKGKAHSRYIPAVVKRLMRLEHGGMCAFPGCNKKARIHHHTRRFILSQSHDPRFIVPLCRSHEAMAHGGLIDGETLPPGEWKLRLGKSDRDSEGDRKKRRIDEAVCRYRLQAGR